MFSYPDVWMGSVGRKTQIALGGGAVKADNFNYSAQLREAQTVATMRELVENKRVKDCEM